MRGTFMLTRQATVDRFRPEVRMNRSAFTLIELLVAMAVFLVLMVLIFQIVQGTTKIWTNSAGKVTAFNEAREAFEAMTRTISQATLNPYVDYVNNVGAFRDPSTANTFVPASYGRRSDLHFISGKALLANSAVSQPIGHSVFFQAPLGYSQTTANQGLQNLLNACGFYLFYGVDPAKPSAVLTIIPAARRFRLMQFVQPAENLSIYDFSINSGLSTWDNENWFLNPLQTDATASTMVSTSEIAENVVALVILPEYSQSDQVTAGSPLSSDYEYDSRNSAKTTNFNQLPPLVQVVMFVIDEKSAVLLGNNTSPPNLGVSVLFQDSTKLSADIATLENNLSAVPGNAAGNKLPLRFEVFQSEVALPGSKWSTK